MSKENSMFDPNFGDQFEGGENLSPPVRELVDHVAIVGIKAYYESQEPHKYVETTPYQGCGDCQIGPGAWFHYDPALKDSSD